MPISLAVSWRTGLSQIIKNNPIPYFSLRYTPQLLEVCVDPLNHHIERNLLRDKPVQRLLPVCPDRVHIALGYPLRQINLYIVGACFLP